MADTTVVAEGKIKFRDGKKWKPRWCVMKKPSPVADRLQVLLFKDYKACHDGCKPKTVFPLDGFYGIESFQFDKEINVMALVCQKQVVLLAFDNREHMIQFEIKIRRSLGQEHQFLVRMAKVPHNSRIPLELIRMHIHGQKFCLTAYIPPKILQSWQICDLRRFGSVEGKFCFEGGSKCGRGTGIHVALSEQAEDIANVVQLASQGRLPSCSNSNLNKRSSQIPAAFDSVGTTFGGGHHGLPPSMLGCCGDIRNQDDWGWQKRHSISVMDYRRMAAFAEKSKLMSIENLERQRLLAIYDVPPKRIRKVEPEKLGKPSSNQRSESRLCPSCISHRSLSPEMAHACSHGASYSSLPYDSSGQPLSFGLAQSARELLKMHAKGDYRGYSKSLGSQGNYQLSVIEDEIRMANDRTKRKEALQKLQNEETSLQREISLLDEILEVCKHDDGKPIEHRQLAKIPVSTSEKSSSLPSKSKKDLRIDTELCNRAKAQPPCENVKEEDMGATCMSPNLLNKLKEIPSGSKLLAPLPYINLSKYDDDGDKSNHIHLPGSGDKLVTASGVSSSLSNVSSINKENSPHTQAIKQKLGARSSSESRIAAKSGQWDKEKNDSWKREPIYANECHRKSDTPPPELPPKGPALLRKNLSRTSHIVPPPPAPFGSLTPPAIPARDRSRSVGSQNKIHGYDNAPAPAYPKSSPGKEDSYLLMGGFQEEPRHRQNSNSSLESYRSSVSCRGASGGADAGSHYMEMGAQYETEVSKLKISDSSSSESDLYGFSPSPRPSIELRITEPIDESPPYVRRTVQESNYMEMTGLHSNRNSQVIQNLQTLQNYVSSTPGGEGARSAKGDASKTTMPFPKLLNFQKRLVDQKKNSKGDNGNYAQVEQPVTPEAPKEGFLARFIRRNSRDQKAASQSQENLTGVRSRSSFLERSQSDQGSEPAKSPETSPLKVGRQRSSSFPNRLSYQEANSDGKSSPPTNDTPPPLPPERKRSLEYRGSKSLSLDDRPAPPVNVNKDPKPGLRKNVTEPLLKVEEGKPEMRVLTVLHVQQELQVTNAYMQLGESSKTDDEKLIELLQCGGSSKMCYEEKDGHYSSISDLKSKLDLPLPIKKPLTASEQAAEIARHVTSLPPFIPPKMKHYSTLSPVIEAKLSPTGMDSESIYVEMKEPPVKRMSQHEPLDPAAQKDKARATLRISPPVEDEDGKIWVPRSSQDSADNSPDKPTTSAKCDANNLQYSTLVVSLDDLNDQLDAISVSSHGSSTDTHSIRSEDTVRSSPASTILRPRSGKDYQVVERRRTLSDSQTSSPKTPYSPSSATVFSFESSISSMQGEEPNSYMNVDMSHGAKSSTSQSEHEVSPERSLRDKRSSERERLSSERERLSSEREVFSSERKRLNSERTKSSSEKETGSSNGSSSHKHWLKHDKNKRPSPHRDVTTPDTLSEDYIEVDCVGPRDMSSSETSDRDVAGSDQACEHVPCNQSHADPVSHNVPISPSVPPEQLEPQLNYAEIDLSSAQCATPPPDSKRKPKRTTSSKPVEYATIDMVATNAVKWAGFEHSHARDSLRRSLSVHTPRKVSTPTPKDRKFSMRERKMSTGSLEDS